MMSAQDEVSVLDKFLRFLAIDYLAKPLRINKLLNCGRTCGEEGARFVLSNFISMDLHNIVVFLGLTACLVPYVYFRFQVGPLCFKSFKLVPYVLTFSSWFKTVLTLEKVSPFRHLIVKRFGLTIWVMELKLFRK